MLCVYAGHKIGSRSLSTPALPKGTKKKKKKKKKKRFWHTLELYGKDDSSVKLGDLFLDDAFIFALLEFLWNAGLERKSNTMGDRYVGTVGP